MDIGSQLSAPYPIDPYTGFSGQLILLLRRAVTLPSKAKADMGFDERSLTVRWEVASMSVPNHMPRKREELPY